MDRERVGKVWTWIRIAVTVPAALVITVLEVGKLFSAEAWNAPAMPAWQFALFLVPIIAIFVIYSISASKKSLHSPQSEPPKPYVMSSDIRRLARVGAVFAVIGACIGIPSLMMKLADGVGTRAWISNACLLLILITLIPTWVQWGLMLWKAPEVA